jgi:hypothetical protein
VPVYFRPQSVGTEPAAGSLLAFGLSDNPVLRRRRYASVNPKGELRKSFCFVSRSDADAITRKCWPLGNREPSYATFFHRRVSDVE